MTKAILAGICVVAVGCFFVREGPTQGGCTRREDGGFEFEMVISWYAFSLSVSRSLLSVSRSDRRGGAM